MYNKLFSKILDSSIWLAPDPHRLVWITLLAAMDEDGNAMFACVDNLALRARVPLHEAESAIKAFENPDSKSGDPDHEGRRVERIPGGWHVLNAKKYRDIVTKAVSRMRTRERTAAWRERKRCDAVVTDGDVSVTPSDESVTPSEAYARSEARSDTSQEAKIDSREVFLEIQRRYPKGLARGDHWLKAEREVLKHLEAGTTAAALLAAATAYCEQQTALGKIGTEAIMRPNNFFSGSAWLGPFPLPKAQAKFETNEERMKRQFLEAK